METFRLDIAQDLAHLTDVLDINHYLRHVLETIIRDDLGLEAGSPSYKSIC